MQARNNQITWNASDITTGFQYFTPKAQTRVTILDSLNPSLLDIRICDVTGKEIVNTISGVEPSQIAKAINEGRLSLLAPNDLVSFEIVPSGSYLTANTLYRVESVSKGSIYFRNTVTGSGTFDPIHLVNRSFFIRSTPTE